MAKLSGPKIDTKGIIDRMVIVGGFSSVADLAKALDISPQALQQAGTRQSISLSAVLRGHELAKINGGGTTLDYLIFGDKKEVTDGAAYIDVPRVGGGVVKFPAELMKQGMAPKSLLAYIQGLKISIINTGDKSVVDGLWAFGDPERPALRQCKLRIDGTVLIEDDDVAKKSEELTEIGVIGKVIWSGNSEL